MAFSDVVNSMAASMANVTNSYVFSGQSLATTSAENYTLHVNRVALEEFLKNYVLVVGIRDIIVASIKDVIVTSDFSVTSQDKATNEKLEKYNKRIKTLGFKSLVLEDLDYTTYYGARLLGMNKDQTRLFQITDPKDFQIIKKAGKLVGYLYKGNFIDYKYASAYWYGIEETKQLDLPTAKKVNRKIPKDQALEKFEIGVNSSTTKSVFTPILEKFYQAYIQDYLIYQLGLRESIRPEILSMVITGNRTHMAQVTNAANNVERLLNQSSNALAAAIDPINFLNQVSFFLLNNIKVVPQVDTFSNMSDLGLGNLTDKRQQLITELDNSKRDILNTIGIPDELYGGNSNRWETISRNDRFATLINNHLSGIASQTKRLVISLAASDNIYLTEDQLVFNLEVSSLMSMYESKSKLSALSDKLREIQSAIDSIKQLRNDELIDQEKFDEYIRKILGFLDADLVTMIDFNKKSEEPEDTDPYRRPSNPSVGWHG